MKNVMCILILFVLFTFVCCRPTEGVQRIYGNPMSEQVSQAFSELSLGTELEAKLDTVLGSVKIKLFSGPCSSRLVETETEGRSGAALKAFRTVNECTEIAETLEAGYVYVPVVDKVTGRNIWVPLPALLKSQQLPGNQILNVQVREIYLTYNGEGSTKLLVQL